MADLLVIDAFPHLTRLERDLISDHSPFPIATQSSITGQSVTLYQMTTFACIVNPKARCRYTQLHTFCPYSCTNPHRFTVQPLLHSSLLMKHFLSPVKGSRMGISASRRGWEQRWNHTQISVVWGLQYAQAESQVPVVFCAVLLEVLSGHTLRRALLEFHIPETTFFSCPLENKWQVLHLLVDQK